MARYSSITCPASSNSVSKRNYSNSNAWPCKGHPLKIVFAGTPDFAVPTLKALIASGHTLAAVYTQPDRPAGRGRKLTASPVKILAQAHGLPIRQPERLKSDERTLAALQPDIMIVIAYGQILPPAVLALPALGCVNVHASLLPRWRGAAPIQRAIEAGDVETGVTIMQMDAGLDTGAILSQARTPILASDTAQTLHDRLALLGAEALLPTLDGLRQGRLTATPQDETQATYATKLRKDEALLDWRLSAVALQHRIRAFNPWPVATTHYQGKPLRVWGATLQPSSAGGQAPPGTIVAADAHGIQVETGEGLLTLTHLQAEGGKPLDAASFLNGHRLVPGERLD